MFAPFEVTIPHIAYACLGGFVVLFGMFSLFLREKLYIGEACWAFLFGVIIGPYGANVFNPRAWGSGSEDVTNIITLEFTRVVLAIGVFAIGVELPKAYMARHWKSLFFLLVPVMTWGWFVSAGLIFALIPGLSFLSSLAVAACLTPTDPILAAAVVGGRWADKHVPAHIRHLLAAESGCNDGAAFPFLFISLYLLLDKSTGSAIQDWFLVLWLYQVIMGAVIGALIGFGFRHLMKFGQRHDLIDRHSYVAQYVSLAMLTIGVTTLLGSDDLLAAFTCGTAFAWDGFFNRQTEESVFSSVIDLLFNVACFVFIGAWMPFSTFDNAALTLSVWRLIVIAILVLLLRRLPAMIALYRWIPDIKTFREAVFSGHFGPIGVGAIFISTLASEYIHKHHTGNDPQIELLAQTIEPIVAFMVLCSITIHGLSIPGFSLGRRVHSVSRTWSRHAPPEWTNQARMVSRPEEIVINRDNEMERGELPPDETLSENEKRSSQGVGDSVGATPYEGSIETRMGDSTVLGESTVSEKQAKPDTPPDGDEVVSEWQEPHHVIIERRSGPGGEVDVEVQNTNTKGLGANIPAEHAEERLAAAITEKLKTAVHAVPHEAERVGHAIEEDVKGLEGKAKKAFPPSSGQPVERGEDDDEGWSSDRSSDPNRTDSEMVTKSKPPKSRTAQLFSSVSSNRRGRQRASVRRGHTHRVTQSEHIPTITLDSTEGRRSYAPTSDSDFMSGSRPNTADRYSRPNTADRFSRPSTAGRTSRPGTGESSLRNHRIDNIRALHAPSTREVSPSRSVRFVDDDRSRGSPRATIIPQNDPDLEGDVAGYDALDSSR